MTFASLILLFGCKDYHNDMIEWTNNIPIGTDLKTVKGNQPEFLEIDWKNPDTLDNGFTRYFITKIKGNNNVSNMNYFLEFENNEFS